MVGVAVVTACAVKIKPRQVTEDTATPVAAATDAPTILNEKSTICVGNSPQKIVTNLPAGMRYAITKEYFDPTTIDSSKILPLSFFDPSYTALDYLQSTGTQYINTGFTAPNAGMAVEYAAQWQQISTVQNSLTTNYIVGSSRTAQGPGVTMGGNYGANTGTIAGFDSVNNRIYWKFCYGNYVATVSKGSSFDQKYKVYFSTRNNAHVLVIDGYPYYTGSTTNQYTNQVGAYPVLLFCNSINDTKISSDTYQYMAKASLYYATIWDSSMKLVRDLVPVRHNASGVYGFYDILNKKFYQNAGTGTFIAGPEVNTNAAFRDLSWYSDLNGNGYNSTAALTNGKYYVYYYTPTSDGSVKATPLKYTSFTVQNHNYGSWSTTKVASCTTAGERQKTCSLCGQVVKESIPAIGTHAFGSWVTVSTTSTAALQRRTCTRCSQIEERSIAPYRHQITIKSSSHNRLVLSVTVYGTQASVFTIQDWVSYLNSVTNPENIACSGTVHYYIPDTGQWYTVTVTQIDKYDNNSFAYFYVKDGTLVKAVTTLSQLTISDTVNTA